jgi:hypothetical protein
MKDRSLTMSPAERRLRARICLLVERAAMIRGSLSVRATVCGKLSCRCARGEKHRAVCLVAYDKGRIRQQHVPHVLAPAVRQWIAIWKQVAALLDQVSHRQWQRLKRR